MISMDLNEKYNYTVFHKFRKNKEFLIKTTDQTI